MLEKAKELAAVSVTDGTYRRCKSSLSLPHSISPPLPLISMPIMMMLMCPAHVKNMLVRSASEIDLVFEKVILRKFITSRA